MRQRFRFRHALAAAASVACLASTGAAFAQDGGWRDGRWQGGPSDYRQDDRPSGQDQRPSWKDVRRDRDNDAPSDAAYDAPLANPGREAWLADCRQRVSSRDRGVGGAVIGGVVGGVAGNRIAGRGNRTVGTLAGAAVGAAAGAVIDKAEDAGRNRDECEAYLDDYYARYQSGSDGLGYGRAMAAPVYASGYGYPQGYAYGCCGAAPVMMVPAAVQPQPECTETVEYVYEDVPVRYKARRTVKRTKIIRDKRVKLSLK
jgi:hypothetical protein